MSLRARYCQIHLSGSLLLYALDLVHPICKIEILSTGKHLCCILHNFDIIVQRTSSPGTMKKDKATTDKRGTYPIQEVTESYNKVTELYNKVTELENSSWNILCLFWSEVAYIGTGHILPLKRSFVFLTIRVSRA